MIYNFRQYIKEELRISNLDKNTSDQIKENLLFRLKEYRTSILSNIVIDTENNKVDYKNFETLELRVILRELSKEFTPELVKELKLETFLESVNEILSNKKRNTKKLIRERFDGYYQELEERFKK